MELDFHKNPSVLGDIVEAMAVGVFTVDAKGRFVAWSEGAHASGMGGADWTPPYADHVVQDGDEVVPSRPTSATSVQTGY